MLKVLVIYKKGLFSCMIWEDWYVFDLFLGKVCMWYMVVQW